MNAFNPQLIAWASAQESSRIYPLPKKCIVQDDETFGSRCTVRYCTVVPCSCPRLRHRSGSAQFESFCQIDLYRKGPTDHGQDMDMAALFFFRGGSRTVDNLKSLHYDVMKVEPSADERSEDRDKSYSLKFGKSVFCSRHVNQSVTYKSLYFFPP